MRGVSEKICWRVADMAEEAWRRGEWVPFWGMTWTSSNPVDNWHNLSARKPGEQPRIVAVYERGADGEIRNMEVLA